MKTQYADAFVQFQGALIQYRKEVARFSAVVEHAPDNEAIELQRQRELDAMLELVRLYNRALTKLQEAGIEP